MLEVLNSPFIHIVLPEKSTQKQTYKMFEPRSRLSYCNACTFQYNEHFSPENQEKINASKVQQHNNKATLTTIKNNKRISPYTMAH